MARVPTATENTQTLQPVTRERFQAADVGASGRAIGAGMQQLGQAGEQYAVAQDQLDARIDDAGAKTIDNNFVAKAQTIRAGFLAQQGLNAGVARPQTETELKELHASMLAQATTPRMRKMVTNVMDQRVAGMMGEFANHVETQSRVAENSASESRIALSADEAIATTDPVTRAQNLATGANEIATRNARMGLGADVTQADQLKFKSGVHSGIMQSLITGDDIDGAVKYHTANAGEMTAADNARAAIMLKDPLERRQTLNDAAQALAEPAISGTTPNAGPVATPRAMFSTIISNESQGHQTNAAGAPLTSRRGAIGIAQILPTTGPEAAQLAGVPWDFQRFKTDGAYNAQLGKAYFEKQLQTFGDPLKAAAAYNAGPGRAHDAMRQANAAGHPEDWQSYLPKETQDYVNKFQNKLGSGVQQQPERHDLNATLARVDTIAQQQGWTPERRDRAKQEVMRRVGVDEQLQNRVEEDAQRKALDAIANLGGKKGGVGFTDISQLPPEVRANLSPQSRLSLMTMAQENAKAAASGANIKADGPEAFNLHRMAQYTPDAFKNVDLGMYQNKVTPGEMESLAQLQGQMRTKPFEGTSQGKIWGQINRSTPDLGFDLSEKTRLAAGKAGKIAPDQQKAMRIATMMKADLDAQTGGTREPTDDEISRSYDRSIRQVVVNGDRDHPVRAYELQAATPGAKAALAVPDVERQQITQAYQRRYRRLPNEGEIARAYAARHGQ